MAEDWLFTDRDGTEWRVLLEKAGPALGSPPASIGGGARSAGAPSYALRFRSGEEEYQVHAGSDRPTERDAQRYLDRARSTSRGTGLPEGAGGGSDPRGP